MCLVVPCFRCCLPLFLVLLDPVVVAAYEHEDHRILENPKTWATMVPPPVTTVAAQHIAVSFPSQDARSPPVSLSERGRRTDCLEYSSPNRGTGRDRLVIWSGG